MKNLNRSRRAANVMLFLCVANLAPVFLLASMGMAAASAIDVEGRYNLPRALIIGLTVLGLPLVITQIFVRRGRVVGMLIGIVLELLLSALVVWLVVSVFAGMFDVLFKVTAGTLALVGFCLYGWGLASLVRAIPEARSLRLKSR
jgi:hypothetical protein